MSLHRGWMRGPGAETVDYRLLAAGGGWCPVETSFVAGDDAEVQWITRRQDLVGAEPQTAAEIDPATGLPTRFSLLDRLAWALHPAGSGAAGVASSASTGSTASWRTAAPRHERRAARDRPPHQLALRPLDLVGQLDEERLAAVCAGVHDATTIARIAERILEVAAVRWAPEASPSPRASEPPARRPAAPPGGSAPGRASGSRGGRRARRRRLPGRLGARKPQPVDQHALRARARDAPHRPASFGGGGEEALGRHRPGSASSTRPVSSTSRGSSSSSSSTLRARRARRSPAPAATARARRSLPARPRSSTESRARPRSAPRWPPWPRRRPATSRWRARARRPRGRDARQAEAAAELECRPPRSSGATRRARGPPRSTTAPPSREELLVLESLLGDERLGIRAGESAPPRHPAARSGRRSLASIRPASRAASSAASSWRSTSSSPALQKPGIGEVHAHDRPELLGRVRAAGAQQVEVEDTKPSPCSSYLRYTDSASRCP